jgi:hypothetical protein
MKTTWIIGGAIVAVLVFAIVYPAWRQRQVSVLGIHGPGANPARRVDHIPGSGSSSHDTREFITSTKVCAATKLW